MCVDFLAVSRYKNPSPWKLESMAMDLFFTLKKFYFASQPNALAPNTAASLSFN